MDRQSKRALLQASALLLGLAVGVTLLVRACGLTPDVQRQRAVARQAHRSRVASEEAQNAAALRAAVAYLRAPDFPNIAWVEIDDDQVFLGFSKWPADGQLVLNGAALHTQGASGYSMVSVWGLHADAPGHRPGETCYGWAICHKGELTTSPQ